MADENTEERKRAGEAGARRQAEEDHDKDREELRARERERRAQSEEDHERFRERERERRRYYGDEMSGFSGVVRDADWFAHSLTRASARAVFGTVRVFEDLVLNLSDSYYAYTPADDDDKDRDKDKDDDRRSTRTRTVERYRSSFARATTDFYDDVSQAIRDEADVLARAVNEFARDDDRDEDDDEDEGEAVSRVARSERRKRRRRKPAQSA
jgi:hypothetical protein